MKAVVFHGVGDIRLVARALQENPIPAE